MSKAAQGDKPAVSRFRHLRWVLERVFWFSAGLLLLLIVLFHGRVPSLDEWRVFVEIVAILTAGVWTYYLFVRGRQEYPTTSCEHHIENWRLGDEWQFLRVAVRLENISKVLIELQTAEVFVRRIRPLPNAMVKRLADASEDEVRLGDVEDVFLPEGIVGWLELGYRQRHWKKRQAELEPGEVDYFYFDFILPAEIQTVEVVSSFENQRPDTPYGWLKSTIYNLEVNDG